MRVVRVRLQNLNSLRGEHEVDFSAEPIAGAGLFAITGPTGAGKSTLLDAVTLALYGRAARYANHPNPEDMMSRHTGECRAEVDFEVVGGVYRAVWQLRRSRGSATGKVQPVKRYLYDSAGSVLADKVRDVDELVEALSGLDYERFMRSVLLAQGEFAKFLRARPNERAGLLESLTGTEIYSELGKLAHEEAARREAEHALREGELARLEVLDEDGRKKLEAEEGEVLGALKKARSRRARYEAEVQKASRLRDELDAAGRVRGEEAKLRSRQLEAKGALGKLAKHRKSDPLAPALERLGDAEGQAKRLEVEKGEAEASSKEAEGRWRRGLRSAWGFAVAKLNGAEASRDAARREIADAEKVRRDAELWLKEKAADRGLGEALPEINRAGARLEHVRESSGKAEKKMAESGVAEAACRERLEAARVGWEEAKAASESARREAEAKRAGVLELLGGRSEEAWREDWKGRQAKKDAMGQWQVLDDVRRAAGSRLAAAEKKVKEIAGKWRGAEEAEKNAERAWAAAREVFEAHRSHLETAKLVAGFGEQRAELKAGEPCPLCGSEEHPFAESGEGRPPATREIEEKLAGARGRLEEAEKARGKARELVVRLGAERGGAEKLAADSAEEMRVAEEKAAKLAGATGISAFSVEALKAAGAAVSAAEEKLRQIRKAGEEASAAEGVSAESAAKAGQRKVEVEAREEEMLKLRREKEALAGEMAKLGEEAEAAGRKLSAMLKPFGAGFDGGDDGAMREGWQDALAGRASRFSEKEKERDGAEKRLGELQGVERESGKEAERNRRWRDALAEKGGADGGEGDAEMDWKNREEAEGSLDRWEAVARERKVALAEKSKQWEEMAGRAKGCSEEVARLAEEIGFESIDEVRSARLPDDELEKVALLEKELESESQRLKGAAGVHAKVIGSLREAGAVEGAEFGRLRDLKARAENEGDAFSEKLAGIREALRRDSENRAKRKELGEGLEAGRRGLETWRKLKGLIGSADGARFSRFAQGISLEVLAGHANGHLARLSDRYVIRRTSGEELELEIVDQYQGGASRPMSSLSGGESFLVSLALALGLSDLAGRNVRIDSLFIDEGFGALDGETLDIAISALDALRMDQKTVGVISHIDLLKERIGTQVVVEKGVGGVGKVSVKAR